MNEFVENTKLFTFSRIWFGIFLLDFYWRAKLPKLIAILTDAMPAKLELVISVSGAFLIFLAASCIAVDACNQKNFVDTRTVKNLTLENTISMFTF